ncbi:hypothetical protein MNBD_DELTA01-2027 [hydrothermal vent metagenome]|uniref:Uncharacterized protein n=1 Tax=hydrothermal vent metagenome TaxID=652676 RepID=A0A3B0R088_9ZZZZ
MKAWLVTWDLTPPYKEITDPLIAILSSRKSSSTIADFVGRHYMLSTCTAEEVAYYANRPKKYLYKPKTPEVINGVPHGDRVMCGDNPFIYARVVTALKIEHGSETELEKITWREPRRLRWKDKRRGLTEVANDGAWEELLRKPEPLFKSVSIHKIG